MNIITRAKNALTAFSGDEKAENSTNLAADFLRYGPKNKPMYQDWSQVEMSDQDMYTGYSYAAIKKRANRAAVLGKRFLYTEASPAVMDAAKKAEKELEHPYLALIRDSKEFTQKKFWHDISTYLDLEGVYYLMAVRAVSEGKGGEKKVGAVQKFVMMNPYQVRRVRNQSTGEVGGYVESRDGMYREIPREMIIEVRQLNPFDQDKAYSMTDAAKDAQFTMKQAGDYTRHSIKGNINAPGAITTDVVLEDEIFDNFVTRIQNHEKGEPLYGNGAGGINWQSMQIDLDKASLDKINEIHRSVLFAVSGTSKTAMGIEESGTGREVSKTQKDDFTEGAVMPQIEDIIDALNLDYRKYYKEWETERYEILLDNPLESDRDAELKDIDIRTKEYEMVNKLQSLGYEYAIAAKYAHGDISLEELGEPTLEPAMSDEEAEALVAKEMGLDAPIEGDDEPEPKQTGASNRFLASNAKGDKYNPYRDTRGKFDDGISIAAGRKGMSKKGENDKKLDSVRKRVQAELKQLKKDLPNLLAKGERKSIADLSRDTGIDRAKVNKALLELEKEKKVSAVKTGKAKYFMAYDKSLDGVDADNKELVDKLGAKKSLERDKQAGATLDKRADEAKEKQEAIKWAKEQGMPIPKAGDGEDVIKAFEEDAIEAYRKSKEEPASTDKSKVSKEEKAKLIERFNEINQEMSNYFALDAKQGGLTDAQAAEVEKLSEEQSEINFTISAPTKPEKVLPQSETNSTLSPDVVVAAFNDKLSNKEAYMAIDKAFTGTYFDADTPVDDIMNGNNENITPQEFYDTFANTREELRKQYGDTIPLYRAEGKQKEKYTKNWATTEAFVKQFGDNIVQKDIPVENVIAINVFKTGKYHEVIVGNPPEGSNSKDKTPEVDKEDTPANSSNGIGKPFELSERQAELKEATSKMFGDKVFERQFDKGIRPNKYDEDDPRWGTEPGTYTVYRSGNLSRDIIFTANNSEGASLYSDLIDEKTNSVNLDKAHTSSYTVEITKPFVSTNLSDAHEQLFGRPLLNLTPERWVKADERIAKKLKSKGYDAWVLTDPAPPAEKEMVIFSDDGEIPVITEKTSQLLSEKIEQEIERIMKYEMIQFMYKDGKQVNTSNDWFTSPRYKELKAQGAVN